MNLATGSSELSAEDIIDAGSAFQSLKVSGKKLYLYMSVLALELTLDADFYCTYFGVEGHHKVY